MALGVVFGIAIVALTLVGLLLLGAGLHGLWHRKLITGSGQGLLGALLLVAAGLSWGLVINLYTYQRLNTEEPVAELHFRRLGPELYRVSLRYPHGPRKGPYRLHGDQWRLEARILKWRGYATLLGFNTHYRLERLSGRFKDVAQARRMRHSVYQLSEDQGVGLWGVVQRYQGWIPWVDALYGSATYMPMADEAHYRVSLSTSGLLARPANEAAHRALNDWY